MATRGDRSGRNRQDSQSAHHERETGSGTQYTPRDALSGLYSVGIIDYFDRELFDFKPYWIISWSDEVGKSTAAVGATRHENHSLPVPFGIQDELLRQGIVEDVVLICRDWGYFYRIPASDFRQFDTSIDDGRRLFKVNRYCKLISKDTLRPIDLAKYQVRIH